MMNIIYGTTERGALSVHWLKVEHHHKPPSSKRPPHMYTRIRYAQFARLRANTSQLFSARYFPQHDVYIILI